MKLNVQVTAAICAISGMLMFSCGNNSENKPEAPAEHKPSSMLAPKTEASPFGVGPIKTEIEVGAIDNNLAATGEEIFTTNCTACHKMDKRHVGPALAKVTTRRNPTWVMNMILNPDNMVKEDPVAKQLLAEYLSPMANQNLNEEQARAVLEYFRKYDQENQ